ncbi:UbiA family prenyltransferase [Fluviicola taffensis]|nr:UbiA family prenyltransferase [Fluviicola taffensis]
MRWFHELVVMIPFIALYLSTYYFGESHIQTPLSGILLLCFTIQLLIAAGCVLNDIRDKDIDAVNKPNTRIIGRIYSVKQSYILFITLMILTVITSILLTCFYFEDWWWISITVVLFSFVYNLWLKRTPLFGNLLMAAMTASIALVIKMYLSADLVILNSEKLNLLFDLFALISFAIIVPRELSLDISDLQGDLSDDCYTLPAKIGEQNSKWVVVLLLVLFILSGIWIVYFHPYQWITFGVGIVLLFVYMYWLFRCKERIDYIKAGRFLWAVMILMFLLTTYFTFQ